MLYIVATPIGNIEDMSFRAAKTLTESDMILAEDMRAFDIFYKKIQQLYGLNHKIRQKLVHYHDNNEFVLIPQVLDWLSNEKTISLVSDSGLPTISDPGGMLIKHLKEIGETFTVIPGPTAMTTAAVLSGFPTDQILYLGFLPKQESHIVKLFDEIGLAKSKNLDPVIVFYESPHRINKTLAILAKNFPTSEIAICREMTKKFEEVTYGKPEDLLKDNFKGELTVVLIPH